MNALKKSLADLDGEVAARLVSAASDIALIVDGDGVIKDVSVAGEDLSAEGIEQWVGRSLVDTVTIESRTKIEEVLRDAAAKSVPRWRQVNHPSARGADLPVRYTAIQIGQRRRTLVLGRDLRSVSKMQQRLVSAQQSMERDYARLRNAETRYRLLFQMSSEAVLIVEGQSEKVTEANPAAMQLWAATSKKIVGRAFQDLFDTSVSGTVRALLADARSEGRVDDVVIAGNNERPDVLVSASLLRQDGGSFFIVRVALNETGAVKAVGALPKSKLADVVENLPDGFVVADLDRRILTANSAFLDLVQMTSERQIKGELLDRWIGRSGVDINVLVSNLRDHGSVRHFGTIVRSEHGGTEDVDISAVSVANGEQPCFGLTIRSVGRNLDIEKRSSKALPKSVEQLTELVGRVPLRDLVRDTTDLIERLCIEAALELAGDNRASAAEMLGLSRQSLYVKLRRYGLGDLGYESEH